MVGGRAKYPHRPRRVASERGRVATCCDRLGGQARPKHAYPNMWNVSASVRLTRSARRHGDTESGFEAGLRVTLSTLCRYFTHTLSTGEDTGEGNLLPRNTRKRHSGVTEGGREQNVLRTIRPLFTI